LVEKPGFFPKFQH